MNTMVNLLKPIKQVNQKKELEYFVLGGALLGCGGGGSLKIGEKLVQRIIDNIEKKGMPISIVQSDDKKLLDTQGAVVALMGSPQKLDHTDDLTSPLKALQALAKYKNQKASFCLPIELGAVNSLVPLLVASEADEDILVVDADGAKRAVPQLENTTYGHPKTGVSISPSAIANEQSMDHPQNNIEMVLDLCKNTKTVESIPKSLEDLAREILCLNQFDQLGGLATYPMEGKDIKAASIDQTFSLIYYLGEAIYNAAKGEKVQAVLSFLDSINWNHYTFNGFIKKITFPQSKGGFDKGIVEIEKNDASGDVLIISIENENLFAEVHNTNNKEVKKWAMAPDLICYMTEDGPLSNVEIVTKKVGTPITIVGLPTDEKMRNDYIIEGFMDILKELNFYNGEYISIEKLNSSSS
ncbi:MAG: DUF917 domain-containing protein [Marinisporobacter sp.]|jgi:DUF917 family protein|nr:DUF917 domain-containing protein [Marinisporobacter sp.]